MLVHTNWSPTSAPSSAFTRVCHKSVNRPREMDSLAAAGVDGIFTDFPERLLRITAPRPSFD